MNTKLYPIKFEPILKHRIWGGEKLKTLLNKESHEPRIGESWEISDVDGDVSIVANGAFQGSSLKDLLKSFGPDLIGEKNYKEFGDKFPLLIKFIDAREDLSIQLHPNDQLAAQRHNSFGKTEMWYVMQADDDSNLIVGFNRKVTPGEYLEHLENKSLTHILNFDRVEKGDTYFIEVGRVHAIGAGVMLAEIQQTSDITYRVYDWDRVDAQGQSRELHNDLALDAIDFDMENDFRVSYTQNENRSNAMVDCPYFKTNFIPVTGKIDKNNDTDSFIIYICVEGKLLITCSGVSETLMAGETLLLPAAIKSYQISAEKAKVLEVYV
jgi:mannose-6-phosphate isomerase